MSEVLKQLGIKKESGYLYYVDANGDVCRSKMSRGEKKPASYFNDRLNDWEKSNEAYMKSKKVLIVKLKKARTQARKTLSDGDRASFVELQGELERLVQSKTPRPAVPKDLKNRK